jgi:hypothetical protein
LKSKILSSREYYLGSQIGEIKAWCEAARCEAKDMSLSELFHPEDYVFLLPEAEKEAKKYQVKLHLEKDFLHTDFWPNLDVQGRWVFVIYKKQEIIERYLALKGEYDRLVQNGTFQGEARKEISRQMGNLLGYNKEYVEKAISKTK